MVQNNHIGKSSPHANSAADRLGNLFTGIAFPRKIVIGLILIVALFAFEAFNFDTTRFALESLLGDVEFAGITWAMILAIAFCAIDFAGLARIFTPEQGRDEPKFVWYLMGAWLLGATMNALMTWWAVNLTLLSHDFGNEVLSRAQLLKIVPLFVAILVWLTRILFIGAFSVAGEHIFDLSGARSGHIKPLRQQAPAGVRLVPNNKPGKRSPARRPDYSEEPAPVAAAPPTSRVQRRPPTSGSARPVPLGMQAQGRRR